MAFDRHWQIILLLCICVYEQADRCIRGDLVPAIEEYFALSEEVAALTAPLLAFAFRCVARIGSVELVRSLHRYKCRHSSLSMNVMRYAQFYITIYRQ